jgi:uncharacterized repeat protein (TIGR01451 family)
LVKSEREGPSLQRFPALGADYLIRSVWPVAAAGVLLLAILIALALATGLTNRNLNRSLPVASAPTQTGSRLPQKVSSSAARAYAKVPLSFIANRGQVNSRVRYYAQAAGVSFYFTRQKVVFAFAKGKRGAALDLRFPGANRNATLEARAELSGKVNYLTATRRNTNIPTYREVAYKNLWPGIDLVFRGRAGRLKYKFLVKPGARASTIRLAYRGAKGLRLGAAGALLVQTPLGTLRDAAPQGFQRSGDKRVPVKTRYSLTAGGSVYGFKVSSYDRSRPLVIDPSLAYSTYLGASSFDQARSIAVDASGSAYATGLTDSTDFPTTVGAFQTSRAGGDDVFVTKLDPSGATLAYSTYLGGSSLDQPTSIAVDASGSAYVTGVTNSSNFPTTLSAYDTSLAGDDAFVAKLDASGSTLAYSTYLGGSASDDGGAIAVDAAGNAYVGGLTLSADFPTAVGAYDRSLDGLIDGFVAKLDSSGSTLAYSTYLGGSSNEFVAGVAVDTAGSAYVSGTTPSSDFPTTTGAYDTSLGGPGDAFAAKLDPSGSTLAYSTFLGGSDGDGAPAIAVDGSGSAYLAGTTLSTDLPTISAFQPDLAGDSDVFVAKLDASGSSLAYSTYLGGSLGDSGQGIAVDAAGSAYVTGVTDSSDFWTLGAFQASLGGPRDAFAAKLDASGSTLAYSTYLGGSAFDYGFDIAVDAAGSDYVTGATDSSDFPTTPAAFDPTAPGGDGDGFVTKFPTPPPPAGADLSVAKADSPDPVPRGDQLSYSITVANAGPATATTVTVVDSLPRSVAFRSASPSQGSCRRQSTRVTCTLDDLAPGHRATVTIVVRPRKSGTISNTATASAAAPTDPNTANNTATESTTVLP